MTLEKPLDVLKKGLSKVTQSLKVRKDELNAKLAQKESISSSDEHWLDHEGNIIDDQHVRTAHQLGGHIKLCVIRGYVLSEVCVKRGFNCTVFWSDFGLQIS
jgi:hypothetical protein